MGSARSSAHASSSRSAGWGSPIRTRSRRHNSACQPASLASAHARNIVRPMNGIAVVEIGDVPNGAQTPCAPVRVRLRSISAEVRGQRRQPRLGERRLDHLQKRPDGPRRQPRIRFLVDPGSVDTAPLTIRPGNGNSTFAQTPSARPGETPSMVDSRCVSQRSTPRVGTATTSASRGSVSGELMTVPSSPRSPSARSAR